MLDATVLQGLLLSKLKLTFGDGFNPNDEFCKKYQLAVAEAIVEHVKTGMVTVSTTVPSFGVHTGIGSIK